MIEKATAFKVGEQLFSTVEEAQRFSLIEFLASKQIPNYGNQEEERETLADAIITDKAHIVDLLTMKATSHPKARAVNGGTKKRTPKSHPAPLGGNIA